MGLKNKYLKRRKSLRKRRNGDRKRMKHESSCMGKRRLHESNRKKSLKPKPRDKRNLKRNEENWLKRKRRRKLWMSRRRRKKRKGWRGKGGRRSMTSLRRR